MTSLQLRALVWQTDDSRLRLDLQVAAGGVAVVVAGSPAATALADVLLGLAAPLSGTIWRGRRDVTTLPPGRRGIALVPPGGGLLPHLTVERNIAFPAVSRWRAHERVAELQLDSIRRLRPHELSPVQRLQVAVARALGHGREPAAVVIEDRAGQIPCRSAVATAQAHRAPVLVLTDSAERGAEIGPLVHPREAADAP